MVSVKIKSRGIKKLRGGLLKLVTYTLEKTEIKNPTLKFNAFLLRKIWGGVMILEIKKIITN